MIKSEHFECGFSIYQYPNGSFRVYSLDENGNRVDKSDELEFYANAVCELISRIVKEEND